MFGKVYGCQVLGPSGFGLQSKYVDVCAGGLEAWQIKIKTGHGNSSYSPLK